MPSTVREKRLPVVGKDKAHPWELLHVPRPEWAAGGALMVQKGQSSPTFRVNDLSA